jgi:hypothetical protein
MRMQGKKNYIWREYEREKDKERGREIERETEETEKERKSEVSRTEDEISNTFEITCVERRMADNCFIAQIRSLVFPVPVPCVSTGWQFSQVRIPAAGIRVTPPGKKAFSFSQ